MRGRLLGWMARRALQPLWWNVYRVAIGGLGYMNPDPRFNGEDRFIRQWARELRARHPGSVPVIFDIGANEGDFTRVMLDAVGDCCVHCFEPNPKTFARLSARFAHESRVIVNNVGVGDAPGTLTLYDYAGSEGSAHASFLPDTFTELYESATEAVEVPVITIDDYLAETGIAEVDYFKVDVEGFEKAVLSGAAQTLGAREVGTVQVEFNAHNILTGLSVQHLGKLLAGYDLYRIVADGLTPMIAEGRSYNSRVEIFKYSNLIARRN